ncbi:uncharacterized protein PF3D7_1120600-like isoform X2 [Daktulosphaira vitifoliae]|uniref:uncharacterized protein PF3D7_1120600-like isoform X2 n=1 Tax=Daktulosphaira vitifoliae TaxID=58002 RepID=UPI0021A97D81|nr:uncharacterized protein PF3D7_1120600-like isoform X2 [Daktulosphaira vitifoliae]
MERCDNYVKMIKLTLDETIQEQNSLLEGSAMHQRLKYLDVMDLKPTLSLHKSYNTVDKYYPSNSDCINNYLVLDGPLGMIKRNKAIDCKPKPLLQSSNNCYNNVYNDNYKLRAREYIDPSYQGFIYSHYEPKKYDPILDYRFSKIEDHIQDAYYFPTSKISTQYPWQSVKRFYNQEPVERYIEEENPCMYQRSRKPTKAVRQEPIYPEINYGYSNRHYFGKNLIKSTKPNYNHCTKYYSLNNIGLDYDDNYYPNGLEDFYQYQSKQNIKRPISPIYSRPSNNYLPNSDGLLEKTIKDYVSGLRSSWVPKYDSQRYVIGSEIAEVNPSRSTGNPEIRQRYSDENKECWPKFNGEDVLKIKSAPSTLEKQVKNELDDININNSSRRLTSINVKTNKLTMPPKKISFDLDCQTRNEQPLRKASLVNSYHSTIKNDQKFSITSNEQAENSQDNFCQLSTTDNIKITHESNNNTLPNTLINNESENLQTPSLFSSDTISKKENESPIQGKENYEKLNLSSENWYENKCSENDQCRKLSKDFSDDGITKNFEQPEKILEIVSNLQGSNPIEKSVIYRNDSVEYDKSITPVFDNDIEDKLEDRQISKQNSQDSNYLLNDGNDWKLNNEQNFVDHTIRDPEDSTEQVSIEYSSTSNNKVRDNYDDQTNYYQPNVNEHGIIPEIDLNTLTQEQNISAYPTIEENNDRKYEEKTEDLYYDYRNQPDDEHIQPMNQEYIDQVPYNSNNYYYHENSTNNEKNSSYEQSKYTDNEGHQQDNYYYNNYPLGQNNEQYYYQPDSQNDQDKEQDPQTQNEYYDYEGYMRAEQDQQYKPVQQVNNYNLSYDDYYYQNDQTEYRSQNQEEPYTSNSYDEQNPRNSNYHDDYYYQNQNDYRNYVKTDPVNDELTVNYNQPDQGCPEKDNSKIAEKVYNDRSTDDYMHQIQNLEEDNENYNESDVIEQ